MKNKNVLEKKDYDFYKIQLPFSMLIGGKRNRYLFAELGKQHPRFSDEFCFDSKLNLNKKGLSCDVIVMEKYRLAEIKNNNPHQLLFIQEKKNSVFDSGVLKIIKSPLFLLGVFICVTGITCGIFASHHIKTAKEKNRVTAMEPVITAPDTTLNNYDLNDFFTEVAESDGKISWIEWINDKRTERFSASVSNVYPEVIENENVSFSTISYSNGIPYMVVNIKNSVQNLQSGEKSIVDIHMSFPDIRELLQYSGVTIIEESHNPLMISFYCSGNGNFFSKLSECISSNHMTLKSLRVHSKDKDLLEVQIVFANPEENINENPVQILNLIGQNITLFRGESKTNEIRKPALKTNYSPVVEHSLGIKTGEIVYSDGTKMVFYKTADGKTVRRKEFVK